MKELAVWQFAAKHLQEGQPVALLAVLQSEGSSPGRQGFKMAVAGNGEMAGSIGGGIMEHKLVELARNFLADGGTKPVLKRQIHSKAAPQNQSGMICSGEQTVAILPLNSSELPVLENLLTALENKENGLLTLTETGLSFEGGKTQGAPFTFTSQNDSVWQYTEKVPRKESVFLVGGGHVALALSQVLRFLNFEIHLFDDRPGLNTFEENQFVTTKTITSYPEIARFIPKSAQTYVVIMTFGYRTDKEVLKELLGKDFGYLGLLGSKAKIEQLFLELAHEGFSAQALQQVYAPIGLPIKSQTPEEIAISIAAQLIQVKNG